MGFPGAVQIIVETTYLGPGFHGKVCSAENRQQCGNASVLLSSVMCRVDSSRKDPQRTACVC